MIYACCKSPAIANMDHLVGFHEDARPIVNRICLKCFHHWYGNAGVAVFEMPRRVWDGWVNA